MDVETGMKISYDAMKEEAKLWIKALGNVHCILPDDAEDVRAEVNRLRREEVERLSEIVQAYSSGIR